MAGSAGIAFSKMSGSGNDFVVVDDRAGALPGDLAAFARGVCRRGRSLGADGVVILDVPSALPAGVYFRWTYLNADGSEGEMCGNGAMCGARLAVLHGMAPGRCRFQTASGVVEADVEPDGEGVAIVLPDVPPPGDPVSLTSEAGPLTLHPVTVGVPHAVALVNDADTFADAATFDRVGRSIRHDGAFPAGVNVNVVSPAGPDRWRMRTYERGVEAETLACGTGAVATAVVAASLGLSRSPVEIVTSGGPTLTVAFDQGADGVARTVRLRGTATIIAEGVLYPAAWE